MKQPFRFVLNIFLFFAVGLGTIFFVAEPLSTYFLPVGYTRTFQQNLPGLKSEVVYERNQFDIRSLSIKTMPKPEKTIRILCLGASTTDQVTQSTADTWSAILEKKLAPLLAPSRVEVGAYGRGGNRLHDTYTWALENVARFQPDIVVLLHGVNDYAFNGQPGYQPRLASSAAPVLQKQAGFRGFRNWCLESSNLCRHGVRVGSSLLTRSKLKSNAAFEWHSNNLPELRKTRAALPLMETLQRSPDPIEEYKWVADAFVTFLQKNKITPVLVTQPFLWKANLSAEEESAIWFPIYTQNGPVKLSGQELERSFTPFNEVFATLAKEKNVPFVALDKTLPKDLSIFFDDVHFTDLGSEKVAEALLPTIHAEALKLTSNPG